MFNDVESLKRFLIDWHCSAITDEWEHRTEPGGVDQR